MYVSHIFMYGYVTVAVNDVFDFYLRKYQLRSETWGNGYQFSYFKPL